MKPKNYWEFPKWCWDIVPLSYVCMFLGERFNAGRYCFNMDE